jgi:RNA polymerase primary sigma factor
MATNPEGERFARITDPSKKVEKLQGEHVDTLGRGEQFPDAKEKRSDEPRAGSSSRNRTSSALRS